MVLTPSAMVELGRPAPDFALPDMAREGGPVVRRDDFAGKPLLVAFLCNHCPYVKHIAPRFAEVARELQRAGIAVVAINSNDWDRYPEDHPDRMRQEVRLRGYTFPYLADAGQEVARSYDARCTPDLFLHDRDHRLAYRGQFDASRPGNGKPVTGDDLVAAVAALLRGSGPLATQLPAMGCNIKWRKTGA